MSFPKFQVFFFFNPNPNKKAEKIKLYKICYKVINTVEPEYSVRGIFKTYKRP